MFAAVIPSICTSFVPARSIPNSRTTVSKTCRRWSPITRFVLQPAPRGNDQSSNAAMRDLISSYTLEGNGPLAAAAMFSARCPGLHVPTIVV